MPNTFIPNTTILSSDVNQNFSDAGTALTNSIATDGQTPTTQVIPFAQGIETDTIAEETSGVGVTVDSTLLKDGNIVLSDSTDPSKKATFAMSGVTAGQTRVMTVPDANLTLVGTDNVQTLSNKTFSTSVPVTSTDAGASVGPTVNLYRDSASPAASDLIGGVVFDGEDSAGNRDTYAQVYTEILDPTSTSEDGRLVMQTRVAGTLASRVSVGNGLVVGSATGGDQGAGTINATQIYRNGEILVEKFTSSAQSMSAGGLITVAHGLSGTPDSFFALLENAISEGGWSTGEQQLASQESFNTNSGYAIWADSTNVYVRMGSAGRIQTWNKTTGTNVSITLANWRLVIKAFRHG